MKNPILFFLILSFAITSIGCRRETPKASTTPSTQGLPQDQIDYRESRRVFLDWMHIFSGANDFRNGYQLLSVASRSVLVKKFAVTNKDRFHDWCETLRASRALPFRLVISRIDVQDVYTSNGNATITAAYRIQDEEAASDEIGTFTLRKENGQWIVPFAESDDMIAKWWERSSRVSREKSGEGFTTRRFPALHVQMAYPQTWDVNYSRQVFIPSMDGVAEGFEISYTPEHESKPEAYLRIAARPIATIDESQSIEQQSSLEKIRDESQQLAVDHTSGRLIVLRDLEHAQHIYVYVCVVSSRAEFDTYKHVFETILSSITPITQQK